MLTDQNRLAALILRDDLKMRDYQIVDNFATNGMNISESDLISLFPPGNTPKLKLVYAGMELSVRQWSKRSGIPIATIWKRYKLGWPVVKILTHPVRRQRNNVRK